MTDVPLTTKEWMSIEGCYSDSDTHWKDEQFQGWGQNLQQQKVCKTLNQLKVDRVTQGQLYFLQNVGPGPQGSGQPCTYRLNRTIHPVELDRVRVLRM